MQKIRLNDEVVVLAGKDKGKQGKILSLDLKNKKVLIEGVNIVKKTMKPTQENPSGGIASVEKAIHISNVAVLSPKKKVATRVRIEERDGKKVRVAVKCGTVLDKK